MWVTLTAAVGYASLADLGFGAAVGRFVGEYRARGETDGLNSFLGTAAAVYGAIFLAVLLLSAVIEKVLAAVVQIPVDSQEVFMPTVLLIGLSVGLGLWMAFLVTLLHTYQHLPLANMIRALYWLLTALLSIFAVLVGWGIVGLAGAMAGASALACALAFAAVRQVIRGIRLGRPSRAHLKQAASYSAFMFVISVGVTVVFQTDNLIIASYLGVAAVTAYAVALRMTRLLTGFLHKIPDVLFPFYAGMRAAGEFGRIRQNFLLTTRLELTGAIALVLALAFVGRNVLRLWVGTANVVVAPAFVLAVTLVILEATIHPAAVLAAAVGGERRMALANNAEAALNVVLSLLLVRPLGVSGVIAGTVIAQAATNLWWLPRWALRELKLSPSQYFTASIRPCLLPCLAGAVTGFLIARVFETEGEIASFAAATGAVGVYVLSYMRWGAGREERRWVGRLLPQWGETR